MNNFSTWWAFCQAPNRDGLANDTDPLDGAGVTRWGFTYPTWCAAMRYAHGSNVSTSVATFMTMTQAGAGNLAQSYFWHRLGGGVIPTGSDVSFIDFCWTSGGAVRTTQAGIGITADGIFGPETLGAIVGADPATFVQNCHDWRIAYYDSIGLHSSAPGDYTRTDDILAVAQSLLAGTPPDVKA
jgi:lysozyme family protein